MSTDLRTILQDAVPDSWKPLNLDAFVREARTRRRRRYVSQALVGVALVFISVLAAPGLLRQLGVQQVETVGDPKTEQSDVAPSEVGETDPLGSDVNSPASKSLVGKEGSSSAKGSPSVGSRPENTISQDRETAGPSVSFTDQANDATGQGGRNATLSQEAFDILRVDWAPVPYVSEDEPGGYSTSITILGTPRADGAYVSIGLFPSDVPGEECRLAHYLRPGTTAFANATCGSREAGRVEGGQVTLTRPMSGGTQLNATFDNRAIPPLLQSSGRRLHELSAITCVGKGEMRDCFWGDILDGASSTLSYRI